MHVLRNNTPKPLTYLNIYFVESLYIQDSSLRSCIPVYPEPAVSSAQETLERSLHTLNSSVLPHRRMWTFTSMNTLPAHHTLPLWHILFRVTSDYSVKLLPLSFAAIPMKWCHSRIAVCHIITTSAVCDILQEAATSG